MQQRLKELGQLVTSGQEIHVLLLLLLLWVDLLQKIASSGRAQRLRLLNAIMVYTHALSFGIWLCAQVCSRSMPCCQASSYASLSHPCRSHLTTDAASKLCRTCLLRI